MLGLQVAASCVEASVIASWSENSPSLELQSAPPGAVWSLGSSTAVGKYCLSQFVDDTCPLSDFSLNSVPNSALRLSCLETSFSQGEPIAVLSSSFSGYGSISAVQELQGCMH